MTPCSVSQKNDTELGQEPTSQARRRDTDHLRPSNLAARTLSLAQHTLSKFSGDPCPVRRGIVAAVKCCARKARFFRCQSRLVRVSTHHKGENLFCFLFFDRIIVVKGQLLWNVFENRKRTFSCRKIINPMDPKLVIFSAKFFGYHFRDGLQPETGLHFRSTSAIDTGVWSWEATIVEICRK